LNGYGYITEFKANKKLAEFVTEKKYRSRKPCDPRFGSTPRAFSAPVTLAVPQIPGRVFHGQQAGALGQETGFQQGAGKADESAALSLPAAWA